MHTIYIRADHTLLFERRPSPSKGSTSLSVPIQEELSAIVRLSFKDKSVIVLLNDYQISDRLFRAMIDKDSSYLPDFPVSLRNEIEVIHSILSETTRKVLSLIKYHLRHVNLSEQLFSIRARRWRHEKSNWRRLPTKLTSAIQDRTEIPLDNVSTQHLQISLNEDFQPLLAMRHLHRASNELIPQYMWIDATIAAELAVKETLIRARPELETLLLEVPAPTLPKLYGPILEKYLGERSPFLEVIEKGARIRNRLVHRPQMENVGPQDAIDYVADIERAIFHLLDLLYPNNDLIKVANRLLGNF